MRCRHLIAVEVDERLYGDLEARFRLTPNVRIVHGDFLRFELPDRPYKVFGNIPYGVTAKIIRRISRASIPAQDIYLVVQREAAGYPYAPETRSSLLLKPWWQVEVIRTTIRATIILSFIAIPPYSELKRPEV